MSHKALQRVLVRMLYDPRLVEAVYADADAALAGVELTDAERRWLTCCDRRLWGADPLRARRSLKALLDEYKGSSALAVARTRRLATLDAFFSSAAFHGCIQHRGSMALAYGDWLRSLEVGDPRVAAVARLEQGLVRARRGRRPKVVAFDVRARWVLSPHVDALSVPAGTLAVLQATEQVLFEISLAPMAAFAEDGPHLASLPALGDTHEHYLAERTEGEHASLSEASGELVALLGTARRGASGESLLAAAVALGASRDDALDVVSGLARDGLLAREN